MYAVVARVEIDPGRADEAEKLLNEMAIPRWKALEGFVSGIWLRSTDGALGRGVIVFDTEDHARAAAENAPRPPEGAPVTFQSAEVVKVLAEA